MKASHKLLLLAAIIVGTSSAYASLFKKCGTESQSATCVSTPVTCSGVPACVSAGLFSSCKMLSSGDDGYSATQVTCSGGLGVSCSKSFPNCK